jgi:hypothetical protein
VAYLATYSHPGNPRASLRRALRRTSAERVRIALIDDQRRDLHWASVYSHVSTLHSEPLDFKDSNALGITGVEEEACISSHNQVQPGSPMQRDVPTSCDLLHQSALLMAFLLDRRPR